ncbi:hypothetical protein T484DRAFT_1849089, partial [Baffinella frigidus]
AAFATADYSPGARVGVTSSEATAWLSETTVVCTAAGGVGATRRVAVTAGLRLESDNAPAAGGVLAPIIIGTVSDFGYTDRARLGATACEATAWVEDTTVICKIAAGLESTLRVVVTAGVVAGSSTEMMSYNVPAVSSLKSTLYNRAPFSSEAFTLSGVSFATQDNTAWARLGASAAEASVWVSDSSVSCTLTSAFRSSLSVVVTSGGGAGTTTEALSFDAVTLFSTVTGGVEEDDDGENVTTTSRANLPSTGSVSITISGASMAVVDYSTMARLGSSACEASTWVSESALVCRAGAGNVGTLRVAVTAGELAGTMTEATSYDAPTLSNSRRVNVPATGSVRVTV